MRTRVPQLVFAVFIALTVLTLGSPAGAKMLPLEVQVSEGNRTVRVSPADFIESVNGPGARGRFGIFEYAREPRPLERPPLALSLIVYSSRSQSGLVHETLGPDVVRETVVAFEYYRTGSGAAGKILRGRSPSYRSGEWVRFTPIFVAIVENALDTRPEVSPVNPPMARSTANQPDAHLSELLVPVLSLAVVIGLLFVLLALRSMRKATEREAAKSTYSAGESRNSVRVE